MHGRFEIEGLSRGPVTLILTVKGSPTWKVVENRTGVRDLVVVLDPGPQPFLRTVDHLPGPEVRGPRVAWEDSDGRRPDRWTPLRADGWVRSVAVPPDRKFEMWAEAEIDRKHVRARGLKPRRTEQRVEPPDVPDITGHVRGRRSENRGLHDLRGCLRA